MNTKSSWATRAVLNERVAQWRAGGGGCLATQSTTSKSTPVAFELQFT